MNFYSLPPSGYPIPLRAILGAVKETWGRNSNDGRPTMQPLMDYIGTKNILYVSSGRAALWLILKALSRLAPDRREVIIPAYTCPAVASAVLKAGLKPILCDNNLTDFGFWADGLEQKMNRNTLAAILIHLFGYPANIDTVKRICTQHNIYLVEDAAQAFGNTLLDAPEKKLGTQADAGFFSFGRGKPINIMHGGIFVTDSKEIFNEAEKVFKDLNHSGWPRTIKYEALLASYCAFSSPYLYWMPESVPFLHLGQTIFEPEFATSPGVDLSAALLSKLLESASTDKETRAKNAQWYSTNLRGLGNVEPAPSVSFPYLRYPLTIKKRETRDRVLSSLLAKGTGAAHSYRFPLNQLPGLRDVLGDSNTYPNARKLADSLIALPVHSGVKEQHRRRIMEIVERGAGPGT